ncbi:hypothetical protein GCM10010424_00030 [Streptomyces lienomycini]
MDTSAASSRFSAAVSTVVLPLRAPPPRGLPWLLRDCPPFARVFVARVAAPDSTVSLPQGSTDTAVPGRPYSAHRVTAACFPYCRAIRPGTPDRFQGCCPPDSARIHLPGPS